MLLSFDTSLSNLFFKNKGGEDLAKELFVALKRCLDYS